MQPSFSCCGVAEDQGWKVWEKVGDAFLVEVWKLSLKKWGHARSESESLVKMGRYFLGGNCGIKYFSLTLFKKIEQNESKSM